MKNDKDQTVTLTAKNGQKVNVRLEVNPRAKRLILRLDQRARQGVAIAPNRRMLPDAAGFAADRIDWLARQLAGVPDAVRFEEGSIFPLRGTDCRLTGEGTGRLASLLPPKTEGAPQVLVLPGLPETLAARTVRYPKKAAKSDLETAVDRYCGLLGTDRRAVTVKVDKASREAARKVAEAGGTLEVAPSC